LIGALKGIPVSWEPPVLLLDVNGVAYELQVPMCLHFEAQQPVQLYTHLLMREDQIQLYGFDSLAQRNVFRILLKINGVGAKMALAILSTWQVEDLLRIIEQENLKALTQIPGVGKKTAERLLVELKHKFAGMTVMPSVGGQTAGTEPLRLGQDASALAQQALEQLGYKPQEAAKLVAAVTEEGLETAELIRRALKQVQTP